MFKELSLLTRIEISTTFLVTSFSSLGIVLSQVFEEFKVMILSLELIFLPTIYIIGNLVIKEILQKEMNEVKNKYKEKEIEVIENFYKLTTSNTIRKND